MPSERKPNYSRYDRKVYDENEIRSILLADDDSDDQTEEWEVLDRKSARDAKSKTPTAKLRRTNGTRHSDSKTKEAGKVSPIKIKRKLSYAAGKAATPRASRAPPTVDLVSSSEEDNLKQSNSCKQKKRVQSSSESSNGSDFDMATPSKSKRSLQPETGREKEELYLPLSNRITRLSNASPEKFLPLSTRLAKTSTKDKKSEDSATFSSPRKILSSPVPKLLTNRAFSPSPMKTIASDLSKKLALWDKLEEGPTRNSRTPTKRADSSDAISKADVTPIKGITPGKAETSGKTTPAQGSTPCKELTPAKPSSDDYPTASTPSTALTNGQLKNDSEKISLRTSARKSLLNTPVSTGKLGSRGCSRKLPTIDLSSSENEEALATPIKRVKRVQAKTPTAKSNRGELADNYQEKMATKKSKSTPSKASIEKSSLDDRTSLSADELSGNNSAETPRRISARKRPTPKVESPSEKTSRPRRVFRRIPIIDLSSSDEELATPVKQSKLGQSQRSLRKREDIKQVEKFNPGKNEATTPLRRSARVSMSPSTPSLRQRVLLANTPRSSLPPLKDASPEEIIATPKSAKSAKKKLDMTPTTPQSCKRVGHGFLSPLVAERDGRASSTPSSALGIARAQLQVSTLPTSLPCREKEFNDIKCFVQRKLQDQIGGCMYISGVPGTGKTATVHTVVRSLQQMSEDGDIAAFDFVEVNGLRLTEPRQAYVRMHQALSKNKVTADQALKVLETRFSGKPKRCTVMLVDELDYLCNKRQDVIYNILDWTTKRHSKLIVLTIANTMDLPERTLKGKVTSRMGLTRIVFQPYTYDQLEKIVLNRLDGCKAFHADAVQLVSRKVAAISGDARRALDICRRSTEILELEGRTSVSVEDIQKVLTQIFAGSRVLAIKNCSTMAKLVLRAIRDEVIRTGVEETTAAFVHPQLVSLCALDGKRELTATEFLSICSNLADSGLIFAEKARKDIHRKISLNISSDDIHYAIDC